MKIHVKVQLHVVLIAHASDHKAGSPPVYEYVGVEQTWSAAVQRAALAIGTPVTETAHNWQWHGQSPNAYAVLPNHDNTASIHIKQVTL